MPRLYGPGHASSPTLAWGCLIVVHGSAFVHAGSARIGDFEGDRPYLAVVTTRVTAAGAGVLPAAGAPPLRAISTSFSASSGCSSPAWMFSTLPLRSNTRV